MGGVLHALIWRAIHAFTQGRGVESSQIGGGVLCSLGEPPVLGGKCCTLRRGALGGRSYMLSPGAARPLPS